MPPRDALPDRLRSALEPETEPEAPEPSGDTPLEQLRHLSQHAESESVRIQALRVLLDREEARRERDRKRRDAEPQAQRKRATDPELLSRLDRSLAAHLLALTYGTEQPAPDLPETAAALREAQERARAEVREPEPAHEPEPVSPDPSPELLPERRTSPPGLDPSDLERAWPGARRTSRHLPVGP